MTQAQKNDPTIEAMFKAGVQYGYSRSRRHPSVKPYIFGVKNRVDIFDIEKSKETLEVAKEFARTLGKEGKQILFVSGKQEAIPVIRRVAERLGMPFVAGRWIGGTFTNLKNIRARIDKLLELRASREKGEFSERYTKKEQLLIDRDIERLEHLFSGLIEMKGLPATVFLIDPGKEHILVAEAKKTGVGVVAVSSSDCDISGITYPIIGNDSSVASIMYFVDAFASAYQEGRSHRG